MEWEDFKFEYRLDADGLFRHVVDIEAFKEAALNLVLPPSWKEQLDRLNRIRAVHGTTALEGNPLSTSEVGHQLAAISLPVEDIKTRVTKEQLQIRNAGIAQDWIRKRFTPGSAPLDLNDLFKMHEMVTLESDTDHNVPGRFRTFDVKVGSPDLGGVHHGAPPSKLSDMMNEFVTFTNSRLLTGQHPVIRALLAHFFLVTIHPFGDGNGRVSRLVEAGILYQGGYNVHGFYGLSNYFYQNQQRYMEFLQASRNGKPFDVTPFMRFGVEGFAFELKGINNFIKTKLNRIVYRDMLVRAFNKKVGERRRLLNQREYSLLIFLISETEPIDPFSDIPSRKIKFSELFQSSYIKGAYAGFTQRTLLRELMRVSNMGFIRLARDEEAKETFLELNFDAIGRY
jgi:Fic family protein